MKLIFDHTKGFGKMQDQLIFYVPFAAFFEKQEYDTALAQGWFPTSNGWWFQSRATRINVQQYQPNRNTEKQVAKVKFYPDMAITEVKKQQIRDIYNKYVKAKGFKETSNSVEEMLSNSHGNIFYAHQNNLIGFLFFKIINKNFLAIEFAWDYEKPSLSLGNVSMFYAWRLAKFKKCDYIYLSAGYESCCQYKANFKGFEWWTGMGWSTDVAKYKELCQMDDKITVANYKYIL